MAEKKSSMLVRAEPVDLAKWKEDAVIRGVSLNQWIVDAANWQLKANVAAGAVVASFAAPVVTATTASDPLLAFDLALNLTPTLTGQRKWVDPQALREEFEKLLTPETSNAG